MITEVANRRRKPESLKMTFPDAAVLDVTSRGPQPWVQLSPFYPHGGIPVPFTPGVVSASVEGIWQALKVFDHADVDPAKLTVTTMAGLKRSVRRYGAVRGHRAGLHGQALLDYQTARRQIYLPSYRWVLEHRVPGLIDELRRLAVNQGLVLLDYTTNRRPGRPVQPAVTRRAHRPVPDRSMAINQQQVKPFHPDLGIGKDCASSGPRTLHAPGTTSEDEKGSVCLGCIDRRIRPGGRTTRPRGTSAASAPSRPPLFSS